jgi:hypothetical protein
MEIMEGGSSLSYYNRTGNYNRGQQGIFGLHPLMTPKYAENRGGGRDNEFRESMARMYLSLADTAQSTKDEFVASLPNDPRLKALAEVLAINNMGFIDFCLTQITEPYSEAMQVDKVLGDNYVAFFFGQEPPVFQYSGMLFNSMQDDQRTGFGIAYQHLLRGSQLARRNALVRIRYDSVIVSGVMCASTQTLNSENELLVPFQFSLLVKEYIWLTLPNDYTKVSVDQYVQLSTEFDKNSVLGDVGRAQDTRIRTTMDTPTQLNEEPVVGTTEANTVLNETQTPQERLATQAAATATKLATTTMGAFTGGVDTIYGNVSSR